MNKDDSTIPWWRQRWPWLLMLGPAVVLVGCIITIFLAFESFSDQSIYDGGVKRGLVVDRPAAASPATQSPSVPR